MESIDTLKAVIPAPCNDLPGLKNFATISSALYRGAQPSREGFEHLKSMGVKTIVNLRAYLRDNGKLEGLGLRRVHLRCRAWLPSSKKIAAFLKVVNDPANQPVFVHCLHGSDRTGLCVASYRMMVQGWELEKAVEELHLYGFHHRVFPQILRYLKRFDPDKIREIMDAMEAPEVV